MSEAEWIADDKGLLANERTFQDWLHMAVTLGLVGAAMLSLSATVQQQQQEQTHPELTAATNVSAMRSRSLSLLQPLRISPTWSVPIV